MTLDRPDVPGKQGHYIFEEMSKVITNPLLSLNSKALLPSLCLDAVRHQSGQPTASSWRAACYDRRH
jgi:hypothetical protein